MTGLNIGGGLEQAKEISMKSCPAMKGAIDLE